MKTNLSDSPLPLSVQASPRPDYFLGLNPEQCKAVQILEGPLLILAGAGTGKTRALTTRISHLILTGKARSWEILAVTFTNKAAREMQNRVLGLIGDQAEGLPWLGTFHSIAAQILRRHAEISGLTSQFTILDTDDQIRLLRKIIRANNLDEKRWTAKSLAYYIDQWKNRGLKPDQVPPEEGSLFAKGSGIILYQQYQERLIALNACDFGDLLLHTLSLFQENPDILALYHKRFRYLLVDEYQDSNIIQYLWLRILAQGSGNLCVVGDDDQSIYGWRGAEVDNILRFEKDFPGTKVIRLEQNYRSTPSILAAASSLISYNKGRLGKNLKSDKSSGEKVQLVGLWDGEAEARYIAQEIENWVSKERSYSEIAILVRASWQMRAFEERFIALGLPYRVIGGPRFFERQEIRDTHAYLRLVRFPDHDLAFERVINTPKRGIGEIALRTLQQAASLNRSSLYQTALSIVQTDEIRGRARTSLQGFLKDIENWRQQIDSLSHYALAELILDESGYTKFWQQDKSPQAAGRLENIKELIQSMQQFESLETYLDHVSLVLDLDSNTQGDEVNLMTLHSAKGLEFPCVFLPGWEETVFPSQRSLDEKGQMGLEEERRLAYVGLTRAKEQASISFVSNRLIYGRWQSVLPSQFIDELPQDHIKIHSEIHSQKNRQASQCSKHYDTPDFQQSSLPTHTHSGITIEGHADSLKSDGNSFTTGNRVFHIKFGYGRVIEVNKDKLTVQFDKAGRKKVMSQFVNSA